MQGVLAHRVVPQGGARKHLGPLRFPQVPCGSEAPSREHLRLAEQVWLAKVWGHSKHPPALGGLSPCGLVQN